MHLKRYGLWAIPRPIPFDHGDLYRQTRAGYAAPTIFQRAIGVRYTKGRHPRFPDSLGGFTGFGPCGAPPSVSEVLKGVFAPGRLNRSKVKVRGGYRKRLANASGYIAMYAPHLRLRSLPGRAELIGVILVKAPWHS